MTVRTPISSRFVLAVLTSCLVTWSCSAHAQLAPRDIAQNARKALVSIRGYEGEEEVQIGSGFFVDSAGVLVTNLHVISGVERLSVELASGEIFDNVYVLAADERRDLAILKVPVTSVPILEVADDSETSVGDTVYVIGNPLGLSGTFSDGLLSARRLDDGVAYLQISAPISEGSSGGPVLNSAGAAIGVSTMIVTDGQNLNLAVPAKHAYGLMQVAGEPIPFATFAAELPSTSPSQEGNRESDYEDLYSALPDAVKATLESKNSYERQVLVRLFYYAVFASEYGFEYTDHEYYGALKSDEVDGFEISLRPGNYVAVAACDNDCVDMDLYVFDSDEQLITKDEDVDTDAHVTFESSRRGKYTVAAKVVDCSVSTCGFGIWVLKEK